MPHIENEGSSPPVRRLSLSLSLSKGFFSYLRSRYVKVEQSPQSSFTLIELLIVIAIIGILASALVLVLNPAQLLSQSRDSRRTQDLSNLNNAI
ncbi:MAG: type II secretion system protein, partial [Patescibacteria group bacterium]|nr:type II secretion system protein [Patescibacteria group bacterium]